MPVSITLFGAQDCEDTARTRADLQARSVPFHEVNIANDPTAEHFVIFINHGFRSTPTLVIGTGKRKIILTEPQATDLDWALSLLPALE
ncbi:glutaredoxin family protein [Thermanaerothrix daxensis]|uniref:glutaredoxin family protein n=1 Tax=Thermanaerothrix daxensis TaxID=869279 RepID=UPI0006C939C8|nr:glutaredoxin domain-containing protein [Thermanaerothrix daxensis]